MTPSQIIVFVAPKENRTDAPAIAFTVAPTGYGAQLPIELTLARIIFTVFHQHVSPFTTWFTATISV